MSITFYCHLLMVKRTKKEVKKKPTVNWDKKIILLALKHFKAKTQHRILQRPTSLGGVDFAMYKVEIVNK